MCQMTKQGIFFLALVVILFLSVAGTAQAQAGVTPHSGSLADGATYLIEVPANWNGTLFLYSHGYVVPGSSNAAQDVGRENANSDFCAATHSSRLTCAKGHPDGFVESTSATKLLTGGLSTRCALQA